jgi:hypothetical protein
MGYIIILKIEDYILNGVKYKYINFTPELYNSNIFELILNAVYYESNETYDDLNYIFCDSDDEYNKKIKIIQKTLNLQLYNQKKDIIFNLVQMENILFARKKILPRNIIQIIAKYLFTCYFYIQPHPKNKNKFNISIRDEDYNILF